MGLNIEKKGGDFLPYVKYNTKAGRWYLKKSEGEVEIPHPTFIADFENIKTGWLYFRTGSAPEKIFDVSLSQPAPKPERTFVDSNGKVRDCFNRGFELVLFSKSAFDGAVQLSAASMHINNAISTIYDQFERAEERKSGKVPVVACTGTEAMKDKQGTNYKPIFQIVKWVDRPAELDEALGGVSAPASAPVQAAPVQQAAPVASAVSEF